ncbi:hypothetical protein [Paeniglutamicibacter sulfureus]|uniref:Uncharacterized protein n=1 Tax=Paeniglutamicibacter sulfureus TaxID=43666 RepID=A0ABU2BEX3_9MICC|nr:hypothetical protein [Paeniglutamicibacter sulfureus]MDR7357187.1 hypothetical protein [Paeniglutamicibacter sulfureus]
MEPGQERASNRVLRIFCDYDAEWPLWEFGLQSAEDYGLSEELSSKLSAWNEDFQVHMHWERGWSEGFGENKWNETGRQLALEVQREVGEEILVVYGV